MIRPSTLVFRTIFIVLYRFLGSTVRVVGDPLDDPRERLRGYRREGKHVIFGVWHGMSTVNIFWYRHRGGSALVEDSWRGDVLAGVLNHFGFRDFRISTGHRPRKSERGVLGFVRFLRQGHDGSIAMDGPAGPARVPKPGILHIAARSGLPILPSGAFYTRSIRLGKRWDGFEIPLPFSRCHVAFGDPIFVPPTYRAAETELIETIRVATEHAGEAARRAAREYRRR